MILTLELITVVNQFGHKCVPGRGHGQVCWGLVCWGMGAGQGLLVLTRDGKMLCARLTAFQGSLCRMPSTFESK